MQFRGKDNFARFVDEFGRRYKRELKYAGLVSEKEMLLLFCRFKCSGKTPEEWFEEQEMS